jgi:prepilin-type N-terminal cleavage/methylation domain-containing protein
MDSRDRQAGFTLIELAIVCVVIGILAGIAMPNYALTKARASRASCASNQRNIYAAATLHVMQAGIIEATIGSADLLASASIPLGLSDCPDERNGDSDDYTITIEGGAVTSMACDISPVDHFWTP